MLIMKQSVTGVSFPPDLLAKLDQARGDIPRSKFIQRLVEQSLKSKKKGEYTPQ